MTSRILTTLALAAVALSASAQTVWGVKSQAAGPGSIVPAALYSFPAPGGPLTNHGPILSIFGGQADVDGLAVSPAGDLFGFEILPGGSSRLGRINIAGGVPMITPVGAVLGNVIRGAAFDPAGRLWALNDTLDAIQQVSPITGAVVGGAPLSLFAAPYSIGLHTDLAPSKVGMIMTDGNRFLRLNPFTGGLAPLHQDLIPGPDGVQLANGGIAVVGDVAFTSDANLTDDIYEYAPFAGWARNLRYGNIIPAFNSGGTDLTVLPRKFVIFGRLHLQDWAGGFANRRARIILKDADGFEMEVHNVELDSEGGYTVETGLQGEVTLCAKSSHWLQRCRNINITENGATVGLISLINGDVDGDNEIGPGDFRDFVHAFMTVPGDPRWNPQADLDGDEEVGPSDFSILASNFGEQGE